MAKKQRVLITGGTGMVGSRLTLLLLERGYAVSHLSRKQNPDSAVKSYRWDIEEGYIDPAAVLTADHIIHLAGAGVADKPWTKAYKQTLIDSRVKTAALLEKELKNGDHHVKAYLSASGSDYYADSGDKVLTEHEPPGDSFLSKVCLKWEEGAERVAALGLRTVIYRIGIVLSTDGGALPELNRTTKFGLASYLGNGKQYYPWIHIDDLCRAFIHALENDSMNGVYNAAAPNPARNRELVETIVKAQGKHAFVAPAPEIALKAMLGQRAEMLLGSHNLSNEKLLNTGFTFSHPQLREALEDLFS